MDFGSNNVQSESTSLSLDTCGGRSYIEPVRVRPASIHEFVMSGFLPVALCCLSRDINIELTRGTQYLSPAENIDVGNPGPPGCLIVVCDSRCETPQAGCSTRVDFVPSAVTACGGVRRIASTGGTRRNRVDRAIQRPRPSAPQASQVPL